jgi:hypothetical protein
LNLSSKSSNNSVIDAKQKAIPGFVGRIAAVHFW